MKTFTVTWHHTTNYGALLQTYALQQTILGMGCDNLVMEYPYPRKRKLASPFKKPARFARGLAKRALRAIHGRDLARLEESFAAFHRDRLLLSRTYKSPDDLRNDPPDADCLITGSDQVWNLRTWPKLIPARFLDFGGDDVRRISYAASIEKLSYTPKQKEMVRQYLEKFDAISLREESARKYIEEIIGRPAEQVLDPVFLLEPDAWLKIAKKPRIDSPCVVCYQVLNNPRVKTVAREIARKTGSKIVSVCNTPFTKSRPGKALFDVPPEEFLGFVANARAVVTTSFHGLAFGLLFGKPTYAVIGATHGNRIRDVLTLCRLERFGLAEGAPVPDPDADFTESLEIIRAERERSLNFLRNALLK